MIGLYSSQIRAAIEAMEIVSPTSFLWMGQSSEPLPEAARKTLQEDALRRLLVSAIQARLYENFYCFGRPVPVPWQRRPPPDVAAKLAMPAQVMEANTGRGRWQSGWVIIEKGPHHLVVERAGQRFLCRRDQIRPESGASPEPGALVQVRLERGSQSASPGYLAIYGDADDEDATAHSVRLYLHVGPETARELVGRLTKCLNRAETPFTLKVLNFATRADRHDSAVLYLRKLDFRDALARMQRILIELAPRLRAGVPALTKPLLRGTAVAESPVAEGSNADSFGSHRCRIIAEGLVDAFGRAEHSIDDQFDAVGQALENSGISLDAPYLGPGSVDEFSRLAPIPGSRAGIAKTLSPERCLRTAEAIADQIVTSAFWHRDRCNWMGAEDEAGEYDAPQLLQRSLGPLLYSGTSGVALFLSELFAESAKPEYRDAALGAMRHAFRVASQSNFNLGFGLYSGGLGVAYAASVVGRNLGTDTLSDEAARIAGASLERTQDAVEYEVGAGIAGAILALLGMGRLNVDPGFDTTNRAEELGHLLVRRADNQRGRCSWPSHGVTRRRNLLGYLHGTAGVAHALLELHALSGETIFRTTAVAAMNYEDAYLNENKGNWADLRWSSAPRQRKPVYSTHWCHGAPGIALTRARAFQVLADEQAYVRAQIGLETTVDELMAAVEEESGNFSLCHGLSGNAEVVDELGKRGIETARIGARRISGQVASEGYRRHVVGSEAWTCGVLCGTAPGLMTGLAGIGRFYLRQYRPDLQSLLLLAP